MNAVVQPLEPQQNRMQLQFDAQTCGVEISRVSYCGQTNFWPSQQIPAGLPFGMIKLSPIADDDPLLDQSKLFHALEQTIRYAEANVGIGLTQTKLFNRKFAHWGAQNFNWPDYSEEKLLRVQKVLNEWDVPPVMVIHDVMSIAKWGRHTKGKFQLSKRLKSLAQRRGQLFEEFAQQYLFRYNHERLSRIDFTAPGNWDHLDEHHQCGSPSRA